MDGSKMNQSDMDKRITNLIAGSRAQAFRAPLIALVFCTLLAFVATPTIPARELEQVQPHNPAQRVASIDQERYSNPAGLPEVVQASQIGTVDGASQMITDFSEVHLAADPNDPQHLIGSSKFFYAPATYGFYTGVFESFDGGWSWSQMQPEGIEAYSLTSDPVNTFDHLGNGYFTLLTRGPAGLDMLKLPKGSDTWEAPVAVTRSPSPDKQWIAADSNPDSPFAGNIYMSWTEFRGNQPVQILFSRSTNGNLRWSHPLELDVDVSLQGSIVAVNAQGHVYVVYGNALVSSPNARPDLRFVRSLDGGLSFSDPAEITTFRPVPISAAGHPIS